jgi:hypothetical protein
LVLHGRNAVPETTDALGLAPPGRQMLDALACAVPPRTGVYVSAPITTGRRYLRWWLENGQRLGGDDAGYQDEHRQNVVEPNVRHVADVVEAIRRGVGPPVIDPTGLPDIGTWQQSDYHRYWSAVISELARSVVFVEGWAYSTGCVVEFLTALREQRELLQEDLTPLDLGIARASLEEAARHVAEGGLPPEPLAEALRALQGVQGKPGGIDQRA